MTSYLFLVAVILVGLAAFLVIATWIADKLGAFTPRNVAHAVPLEKTDTVASLTDELVTMSRDMAASGELRPERERLVYLDEEHVGDTRVVGEIAETATRISSGRLTRERARHIVNYSVIGGTATRFSTSSGSLIGFNSIRDLEVIPVLKKGLRGSWTKITVQSVHGLPKGTTMPETSSDLPELKSKIMAS
jgi:hypothetical protein